MKVNNNNNSVNRKRERERERESETLEMLDLSRGSLLSFEIKVDCVYVFNRGQGHRLEATSDVINDGSTSLAVTDDSRLL